VSFVHQSKTINKLAYKEQKELDELPAKIEAWEEEKETIEKPESPESN